jgi:hypothetical protein
MARKIDKERRERLRRLSMEKDTIYYLDFVPKDGRAVARSTLLNDPWCVVLPGKPEGHPEFIEDATRTFEKKHNVKSWDEVAVRRKVESFYYP